MTRLKKLPEEHLLKPPSEVTKSSTAAGNVRKKGAISDLKEEHTAQPGAPSPFETTFLDSKESVGNLESSDTAKPLQRTAGVVASPSDSTLHALPESGHHRRHSRKSHSARIRRHQHHPHHSADPEATPECIVEAVFNPKPSNIYTPFTYVVPTAERSTPGIEGKRPTSLPLPDDKLKSAHKVADDISNSPTTANTTMTSATRPVDSADEGSDANVINTDPEWSEGMMLQPHAREQARWNAAEGVWERRRGRGYGKMRMIPRRPVCDIERPFFSRIGRIASGGANRSQEMYQPVHV